MRHPSNRVSNMVLWHPYMLDLLYEPNPSLVTLTPPPSDASIVNLWSLSSSHLLLAVTNVTTQHCTSPPQLLQLRLLTSSGRKAWSILEQS